MNNNIIIIFSLTVKDENPLENNINTSKMNFFVWENRKAYINDFVHVFTKVLKSGVKDSNTFVFYYGLTSISDPMVDTSFIS